MIRVTELQNNIGLDDKDYLLLSQLRQLTVTFSATSPTVVSCVNHNLPINTPLQFIADFGGTLPTGISGSTTYYVSATSYGVNSFKLALVEDGTTLVNASDTGTGTITAKGYVSVRIQYGNFKTYLNTPAYSATFTPVTAGSVNTITHNLNTTDVLVELYDSSNVQIFADSITTNSNNTIQVVFGSNPTGNVRVVISSADTYNYTPPVTPRQFKINVDTLNKTVGHSAIINKLFKNDVSSYITTTRYYFY